MLKIKEITVSYKNRPPDIGSIEIECEGETSKDFIIAQEIMRALVSQHFCRETSFGLNEKLDDFCVFSYPYNREITLEANITEGSVSYGFGYIIPNNQKP